MTVNLDTLSDAPKAAGTGIIRGKGVNCRYSIFQPAVTQWVAIGIVCFDNEESPQLVVEAAANPKEVPIRLSARVSELNAQQIRRTEAALAAASQIRSHAFIE